MAKKPRRAASADAARRAAQRGAAAEGAGRARAQRSRPPRQRPGARRPAHQRERDALFRHAAAPGGRRIIARASREAAEAARQGARARRPRRPSRPCRASPASMASTRCSSSKIETPQRHRLRRGAHAAGRSLLADVLAQRVEEAIKALPIPKVMRWGDGERAVRAAGARRWSCCTARSRAGHGARPGSPAGTTRGHRFHGRGDDRARRTPTTTKRAARRGRASSRTSRAPRRDRAPAAGAGEGRAARASASRRRAARRGHRAGGDPDASTSASSTPEFLAVPPECLILTMRQNQKYFPLFDAAGKLLPRFLIVCNMRLADPAAHRAGQRARGAPAAGGCALLLSTTARSGSTTACRSWPRSSITTSSARSSSAWSA